MKKLLKSTLFLSLAVVAVSCKNEPKKTEDTTTPTEEAVTETKGFQIELEGNDAMQYNKTELKVPVGETVVLTLKHTGKMAKEVMGHNFVLLKKGTDFNDFATKASEAKDTDYVPAGSDAVIAHTSLVGGGESTTVEFTITEAGSYDFLCTFPAHAALMKGVLIAE